MGYYIIAGVMASRAQWMFGIFAAGLQMAMKLNHNTAMHVVDDWFYNMAHSV